MYFFVSPAINQLINLAIEEDIINSDMTSIYTVKENTIINAHIIAKEDMIFCGGVMISPILEKIDKNVKFEIKIKDGEFIKKGTEVVTFEGNAISILSAERTILNFMQRMSGIATKTNQFVKALNNVKIKIVDTRKTLPGFRYIDKYSVKMGGGFNHRMGLSDAILIKENHIKSAGSISKAIKKVKLEAPHTMKVECEVTNLKEVKEAIKSGANIIMLDNMTIEMMQDAIKLIRKNKDIIIEVSGNVTLETLPKLANLDIDIISSGALTHSVIAADLSMKFL
jgi:nicotinate-nucleotide pyrophosphorylase (carboxylating)